MVSESLATRLFTSPTNALGQSVTLGGRPYTVVGVLPRDFVSIPSADVLDTASHHACAIRASTIA